MYYTFTFNRQFRTICIREHDEATGLIIAKYKTCPLIAGVFKDYASRIADHELDLDYNSQLQSELRSKFITIKYIKVGKRFLDPIQYENLNNKLL